MKPIVCLPGYSITSEIHASDRTLIYRGMRDRDRDPVIIKVLRKPFPSYYELMQFRHQYDVGKDLDLPYIVKTLALETYQNSYALILGDGGGVSLKHFLQQSGAFGENNQTLMAFLPIAIQLAEAMNGLYMRRVIHKDIKPSNILINSETQQI